MGASITRLLRLHHAPKRPGRASSGKLVPYRLTAGVIGRFVQCLWQRSQPRITTHSTRSRFAARVTLSVMRYRVEHLRSVFLRQLYGNVQHRLRIELPALSAIGQLVASPWHWVPGAPINDGFDYSTRQGFSPKPPGQAIVFWQLAVRGHSGTRCGNLLSWPVPHNKSFKPKLLRNSA
jgi:hypothetical protein